MAARADAAYKLADGGDARADPAEVRAGRVEDDNERDELADLRQQAAAGVPGARSMPPPGGPETPSIDPGVGPGGLGL
jgi:hypothetical protein